MRGSFSIKKVLGTIAPKLEYGKLGGVTDGTGAQVAYLYAVFDPATTGEKKEEYRRDLIKYCGRETLAMVEVTSFLVQGRRAGFRGDRSSR
jgi:hypothetical protein